MFILGILIACFLEYIIHKYVLHSLGKKKDSIWAFHWKDHHAAARKNEFYDYSYNNLNTGSHTKELLSLIVLTLIVSPLIYFSLSLFLGMFSYLIAYYYLHRKCHLDPVFCKTYMPWHYEHHMGKNQDSNWNVVLPIFDILFKGKL